MDNNTFYLHHFETKSNIVRKQWKWNEYIPKVKEGKKSLPKKYHYFRRKLYNDKGKCFLVLSLRYDDMEDVFRLRINGSLRNWFFNENSIKNLTKPQYIDCNKKIAEKLGISYEVLIKAKNTKIESGITIRLKTEYKNLLKCFVWYKNFKRVEERDTSLYFRGKFYDFILYEKNIQIKSKYRFARNKFTRAKTTEIEESYLRFEVKVKAVSGVTFYKKNAGTIEKVIENWDTIIIQIQQYFENIKFIDMNASEKEFNNISASELKKYLMFKGIRENGMYKTIDLLNKINLGTNITKYRNEIFSLYQSYILSDIDLRQELLDEFVSKINSLIYNKVNISSKKNNKAT
ncbi:hypothetical protein [Flavobacterium sp.]|uniref:hypothetical protein n=1 Tax=Flavobacterium sp. TaxID=239 RepID=UPI003918D691